MSGLCKKASLLNGLNKPDCLKLFSTTLEISAETLCLHGDNKSSVGLASVIRKELERSGIQLSPMHTFVK